MQCIAAERCICTIRKPLMLYEGHQMEVTSAVRVLVSDAAELRDRIQALTLFSSMMSLRKAGSFTRLRVTARWTSGWFTCMCAIISSAPCLC